MKKFEPYFLDDRCIIPDDSGEQKLKDWKKKQGSVKPKPEISYSSIRPLQRDGKHRRMAVFFHRVKPVGKTDSGVALCSL